MDNKSEVTFVTDLEVSGFLNGVINMAFSTAQFVPELDKEQWGEDGKNVLVVAARPVVTANLRFDLRLAQIIRDRLDAIIDENTGPASTKATN